MIFLCRNGFILLAYLILISFFSTSRAVAAPAEKFKSEYSIASNIAVSEDSDIVRIRTISNSLFLERPLLNMFDAEISVNGVRSDPRFIAASREDGGLFGAIDTYIREKAAVPALRDGWLRAFELGVGFRISGDKSNRSFRHLVDYRFIGRPSVMGEMVFAERREIWCGPSSGSRKCPWVGFRYGHIMSEGGVIFPWKYTWNQQLICRLKGRSMPGAPARKCDSREMPAEKDYVFLPVDWRDQKYSRKGVEYYVKLDIAPVLVKSAEVAIADDDRNIKVFWTLGGGSEYEPYINEACVIDIENMPAMVRCEARASVFMANSHVLSGWEGGRVSSLAPSMGAIRIFQMADSDSSVGSNFGLKFADYVSGSSERDGALKVHIGGCVDRRCLEGEVRSSSAKIVR